MGDRATQMAVLGARKGGTEGECYRCRVGVDVAVVEGDRAAAAADADIDAPTLPNNEGARVSVRRWSDTDGCSRRKSTHILPAERSDSDVERDERKRELNGRWNDTDGCLGRESTHRLPAERSDSHTWSETSSSVS